MSLLSQWYSEEQVPALGCFRNLGDVSGCQNNWCRALLALNGQSPAILKSCHEWDSLPSGKSSWIPAEFWIFPLDMNGGGTPVYNEQHLDPKSFLYIYSKYFGPFPEKLRKLLLRLLYCFKKSVYRYSGFWGPSLHSGCGRCHCHDSPYGNEEAIL